MLGCRTYGGTLTDSDHRLLVSRLSHPKFYGLVCVANNNKSKQKRYRIDRLTDDSIKNKFQTKLGHKLEKITELAMTEGSSKFLLDKVYSSIRETAVEVLGIDKAKHDKNIVDDELLKMSEEQKNLRLMLMNESLNLDVNKKREMKSARNRILKRMRRRVKHLKVQVIKDKIDSLSQLKESSKQFAIMRSIRDDNQYKKPIVNDDNGDRIVNSKEVADYVKHFQFLFYDKEQKDIEAFPHDATPLDKPIT